MKRKTIALAILGNIKDANGDNTEARWNVWRPTIGLVSQKDFAIDELHLTFPEKYLTLAETIRTDIQHVSPQTKVVFEIINLKDAWDFEEVYSAYYKLAKSPCFHQENTDLYIHISTGSHVQQICLFLLTQSHHLPGKLVQTVSAAGHGNGLTSTSASGSVNLIDLDLSRYDKLAKCFEAERQDDLSFLKQGIETKNAAFNHLIETIERVATRSVDPILLTGPTGAGKSQLASQIYELKKHNGQVKGPFVDVNCAMLGGELAKAALFGYRKGAFTGADSNRDGFLKEADGGILFLDEIGELPLEAQAMLLKAIEKKTFRPLGATKDEYSDFQLICGTNRDLAAATKAQPPAPGLQSAVPAFRADLLARINLWSFKLPGLADRREDIEPNLAYELNRYARRSGKHITFNTEAREKFLAFALDPANLWPGNFRDLNAMVVRMATLSDGGRITEKLVDEEIARGALQRPADARPAAEPIQPSAPADLLARVLGPDYTERFDSVDLAQLAHTIAVCRQCDTAAEAAKRLFAVSRKNKTTANDSDRLTKFLARFGLKFKEILRA